MLFAAACAAALVFAAFAGAYSARSFQPSELISHPSESFTAVIAVANILFVGFLFVQIQDNRRSSERQLRAYLCIEIAPEDRPNIDPDQEITIFLRVVNRGQTPAYQVKQVSNIGLAPFPLIGDLPIEPLELPAHPVTIGPSAYVTATAHLPRALTQAERNSLLQGSWRIYIFGATTYLDTFGGERKTKYRMMIPITPNGQMRGIKSCEAGNEAT